MTQESRLPDGRFCWICVLYRIAWHCLSCSYYMYIFLSVSLLIGPGKRAQYGRFLFKRRGVSRIKLMMIYGPWKCETYQQILVWPCIYADWWALQVNFNGASNNMIERVNVRQVENGRYTLGVVNRGLWWLDLDLIILGFSNLLFIYVRIILIYPSCIANSYVYTTLDLSLWTWINCFSTIDQKLYVKYYMMEKGTPCTSRIGRLILI